MELNNHRMKMEVAGEAAVKKMQATTLQDLTIFQLLTVKQKNRVTKKKACFTTKTNMFKMRTYLKDLHGNFQHECVT